MRSTSRPCRTNLLQRIARDEAGNALMIIAASLLPLLAMVGGGVDIGRGYLVQARLQQACDAGVLAARKRLGTESAVTGEIPSETAEVGDLFFKTNFRDASYGSTNRDFEMTLEEDYAVSGVASARVPTTLMGVFGHEYIDVTTDCVAQLNMANTDIMMVLDVTGSMALTNPTDTETRLEVLKSTVRTFYDQLSAAESGTSRIRFGFLPYSTNVNVGADLQDDWVLGTWDYQSRESINTGSEVSTRTYDRNWKHVSGSQSETVTHDTYPATWNPGGASTPVTTYVDENENVITIGGEGGGGWYSCNGGQPANSYSRDEISLSKAEYPFAGPPSGTQTVDSRQVTEDGKVYWTSRQEDTCYVQYRIYDKKVTTWERVTEPQEKTIKKWRYKQLEYDVSNWRSFAHSCIEERDTYVIDDYDNVDFTRALDLDIDLVPNSDESRWRPMHESVVFARDKKWDGTGTFKKSQTVTKDEFISPAAMGVAPCPPAAKKLGTMSGEDIDGYLDTLYPTGATYHDIGMIWGGRYLSPTGLFASENADVSASQPTSRHMIFLTDGETETLDLAYSSYGIEPVDARRWDESSSLTLTQTVEARFKVACSQVRKRGITVWVVGFGTSLNQIMKDCAGEGYYFEAADEAELNATFAAIAKSLAELRITQ